MKYSTGEIVEIGDNVGLGDDLEGVVVCNFDLRQYTMDFTEIEWGHLKSGVLIRFPKFGLIHYEHQVERELFLIGRKQTNIL